MPTATRPSAEEIGRRGEAIYESKIRANVEAGNFGKYLVIDTVSGDYEMDEDYDAASVRAAAKHPDGHLFAMRIGFTAMGRMGAQHREARR